MITIFEHIPDLFVQIYDAQFQTWAREFKTRGRRRAIIFVQRFTDDVQYDEERRVVHKGAWLHAEPQDDGRMIVRPASEHDREMIERHCREMQDVFLH